MLYLYFLGNGTSIQTYVDDVVYIGISSTSEDVEKVTSLDMPGNANGYIGLAPYNKTKREEFET